MPPRQGRRLEQAERERVEIVSFPECFLTGYPDTEELVRWDAFAIDSAKLMQVLDATSRFEPVLFVGFDELAERISTTQRWIVVRSRRHVEDFLFVDIDPTISDRSWNVGRSMWSAREFSQQLL